MSRGLSPRVLITFGWVLLLPIGAYVLCTNGFVGEVMRDEQYKREMSGVLKLLKPTARLGQLITESRSRTFSSKENAEVVRLMREASVSFGAVASKLESIKPQEKDRAAHEDLIEQYKARAKKYEAAALDWETRAKK